MNQMLEPKIIRNAVRYQTRSIRIGRSWNTSGAGAGTPIRLLRDSDAAPSLCGQPYLKTGFSNGRGFSCTLYTPSTLCITVGENWNPYDRD